MQATLAELVPLRLVPRDGGEAEELWDHYGLRGYPTLLFVDAYGRELDRIVSFRPPQEFLDDVRRIRAGDTFGACLERLDRDPGNLAELERAVRGHLDRYDPMSALARIDAFRATRSDLDPDPIARLLTRALAYQHSQLYQTARHHYRNEWEHRPEVSDSRCTPALATFLEADPATMEREEQAHALRQAMYDDAALVLASMPENVVKPGDLFDAAFFAFRSGHYETAIDLYMSWHEMEGAAASSGDLNAAAWDMYLYRRVLDLAVEIARQAYAIDSGPNVGDTLGRLLYVTGTVAEGIQVQARAAAEESGSTAEEYAAVVERMRAGEELDDRPAFETFPSE